MVKKSLFIMILLTLFSSAQAFAAAISNEADPGSTLSVDAVEVLNFNFSPSVAGQYTTEALSGNEQWYAISTYHAGGSLFYGSSADSTVVYRKPRTTIQQFTAASVPTAPADTSADTAETADDIWAIGAEGGWNK